MVLVVQRLLFQIRQQEREHSMSRIGRDTGFWERSGHRTRRELAARGFIAEEGQPDLLQIVRAGHAVGGFADFLHRGQEKANQDGDDGDNHEQFDQCKTV